MPENRMRIWRFHDFGSLDTLRLEERSIPEPDPGEVRVKLSYAALNPADAYLIRGQYPRAGTPPFAVGRDGCGQVVSAGQRFKEGDWVVILRGETGVTRDGTLAEYVTVAEESLAPLPEGWTAREGAAAPLVFLTAWQALVDAGGLTGGQTVLITGASGGLGTAALILAKCMGARAIATTRSPEKQVRLRELGADAVADTDAEDFVSAAREAMDGGRADMAVENLGGPFIQHCIQLVKEQGRIAVVGLLAGLKSEIIVGQLIFKRARIEGVQVGAYTPEAAQEAWRGVVESLEGTGRRPVIDNTYAMDDVRRAFDRLAEGPMGKVIVAVGDGV